MCSSGQIPTWESVRPWNIATVLARLCRRHQDGWQENMWDTQRTAEVDHHAVQAKAPTRNKTNTKTSQLIAAWSQEHQIRRKHRTWMIISVHPKTSTLSFVKFLYLARTGRPDSLTERNKACDKRLARLLSFFDHTQHDRQKCFVRNKIEDCNPNCNSVRKQLPETYKIQTQIQGEYCACLDRKHLFQFVGCARNKWQDLTAVPNLK